MSREGQPTPKTSLGLAFSTLSASQQEAVEELASPLCILAGPGSGKTRVLTVRIANRIEHGSARANHIVAVTFTRKAAGELRQRLHSLGVGSTVTAGTFHGIALASLRQWYADNFRELPHLLNQPTRLIEAVMTESQLSRLSTKSIRSSSEMSSPTSLVKVVAGEIGWAKARMLDPAGYPIEAVGAHRQLPIHPELIAKIFSLYEQAKHRRRLMDLDDILLLSIAELRTQPTFSAIMQWRFRHLFVDEFQDINPLQLTLLKEWLGGNDDLCLVGDPAQSIYGWNGADSSLFAKLPKEFPGIRVVTLEENFRSTPQIVRLANVVYPLSLSLEVMPSSRATVQRDRGDALPDRSIASDDLHSTGMPSTPSTRVEDGPLPTFECYETDQDEATAISKALRAAYRSHIPWSEMAVLARTNAQLTVVSQTLTSFDIPHRILGGIGGSSAHRRDGRLRSLIRLARTYRNRPLSYLIADLTAGSHSEHEPLTSSLLEMARDYSALDPRATVRHLMDFLAAHRFEGALDDPDSNSVNLATFHRAKGLEWSKVFLIGLEDGFLPMHTAVSPEQLLEERRLFYVAMTRAKRELHLSWAQKRTLGEMMVERKVSPFAEEVSVVLADMQPTVIPREQLKRLIDEERKRLEAKRSDSFMDKMSEESSKSRSLQG